MCACGPCFADAGGAHTRYYPTVCIIAASVIVAKFEKNRALQFPCCFRHDNDLGGSINDLTHHVVLSQRRISEYRVKGRDDGHFQARQEVEDITAGFPAENSILMLNGYNVEITAIQKCRTADIIIDQFFANLKPHRRWIILRATRVRHRSHASFQIRQRHRNGPMEITGKGSDSTQTWEDNCR